MKRKKIEVFGLKLTVSCKKYSRYKLERKHGYLYVLLLFYFIFF